MRSVVKSLMHKSGLKVIVVVLFAVLFATVGYLLLKPSHAASADINGDGTVGIADLSILAFNYGGNSKTAAQGDLNGDGTVNVLDFSALATNWGSAGGGSNLPQPIHVFYQQANQGYIYTADKGEVAALSTTTSGYNANSNINDRIGFWFEKRVAGTMSVWRLKKVIGGYTAYYYTVDSTEKSNMLSDGYQLDKVAGWIYPSTDASGDVPTLALHRLSGPNSSWQLETNTSRIQSLVTTNGYHDDGVIGYVRQSYQVGAIYFSFWEPESLAPFLQTKINQNISSGEYIPSNTSGAWWSGVRDFAESPITSISNLWPSAEIQAKYSQRKPLQGYYDDTKTSTLETQINQASSEGIDYFNFYYFWNGKDNKHILGDAVPAFLSAANNNEMNFTLSLFASSSGDNYNIYIPPAQYATVANQIVDYMKRKNYLRTFSSRPIFSIMNAEMIGATSLNDTTGGQASDVNAFISTIRTAASNAHLSQPFILINSRLAGQGISADGYTCQNSGVADQGVGPISYQTQIGTPTNPDNLQPFLQCATSDFDERSRTGLFWNKSATVPASVSTPIAQEGETVPKARYFWETRGGKTARFTSFLDAINVAKNNLDNQPRSQLDNLLAIYAWNEWHEGGVIEPSVNEGSCYLDLIAQIFILTAGNGSCNASSFLSQPLYWLADNRGNNLYLRNQHTYSNYAGQSLSNYNLEGQAGYILPSSRSGTVPLYRLFKANDGDNFYVTSYSRVLNAISTYGYSYVGIEGYIQPSQVANTQPLYALNVNQRHFYTVSASERSSILKFPGTIDEGIAGYVYTSANK